MAGNNEKSPLCARRKMLLRAAEHVAKDATGGIWRHETPAGFFADDDRARAGRNGGLHDGAEFGFQRRRVEHRRLPAEGETLGHAMREPRSQ